jgi:hypothetical protein
VPFCQECGKKADLDEDFCPSCGFSLKGLPYRSPWVLHRDYHEKRISCPHCPPSSKVYNDPTRQYLSKRIIEREFIRNLPRYEKAMKLAEEERKRREKERKRRKEERKKLQQSFVTTMLLTPEPETSFMWSEELKRAFQKERQAESACLEAISRYGTRRVRASFRAISEARQARYELELKETGRIDGYIPKKTRGKVHVPSPKHLIEEWYLSFGAAPAASGATVSELKGRWRSY